MILSFSDVILGEIYLLARFFSHCYGCLLAFSFFLPVLRRWYMIISSRADEIEKWGCESLFPSQLSLFLRLCFVFEKSKASRETFFLGKSFWFGLLIHERGEPEKKEEGKKSKVFLFSLPFGFFSDFFSLLTWAAVRRREINLVSWIKMSGIFSHQSTFIHRQNSFYDSFIL